jgi:hypothetical protein
VGAALTAGGFLAGREHGWDWTHDACLG